jgi:hypothetical protein
MSRPVDQTTVRERGAIIIYVAIALLALIVFSAFVVDYGVMWVARTQAQAAADAGALAGALTLAQHDIEDITVDQDVLLAAQAFVAKTAVWGEATAPVNVVVATSLTGGLFPLPSPSQCAQPGCVRVDVMRGTPDHAGRRRLNVLPTFFAQLVGITSQGVRATATAQVVAGNATNCLKPWVMPDRWTDTNGDGKFQTGEPYQAPSATDPGTGWRLADVGTYLTLKERDPSTVLSTGDYYELGADGRPYTDAITGCTTDATLGDTLTVQVGTRKPETKQAVDDLIQSDFSASWDSTNHVVINSNGNRIVPIALFSPAEFAMVPNPLANFDLTLVNLLGFFVNDVQSDGTIHGYIVSDIGMLVASGNRVGATSAFVKIARLIQ